MRQISVSLDIFAKLWALRKEGEATENDILARLLDGGAPSNLVSSSVIKSPQDGFRDLRHGVLFPEGFEIFRTFKGANLRATASCGKWVLEPHGTLYNSLNELSRGVGAGIENAWTSWFFLGDDGRRRQISALRDPTAVSRRLKPKGTKGTRATPAPRPVQASPDREWLEDVKRGLASIEDERGLLRQIYKAVEAVRRGAQRDWPVDGEDIVLRILEENSSDSEAFKGGDDVFCMPYGKGAGFWAVR